MIIMESIEQVMQRPNYSFRTDNMIFKARVENGKKKFYVKGYISTGDIDLYNDLVTPTAMKSMLRQIMESTITLDYEHENFREDVTILPVGKIIEAKIDENGLWVKAELNKHSPKFKDLWGSIKGGFVNAFSIAFQPLKTIDKKIGDVEVRLIEDLKLLNVALTGIPVNKGAVMTDYGLKSVMLKAIQESEEYGEQVVVPKRLINKLMEEKSMEKTELKDETVTPETPVEATDAAPEAVSEAEASEGETESTESTEEASAEEATEESAPAEEAPAETAEAEPSADVEQKSAMENVITELKSKVEELEKSEAKLKADLKSLKETKVFKSPVPAKAVEEKSQPVGMLSRIR